MSETIRERVREIIAQSGLPQKKVAERIGIDAPKLSKSLKGVREFTSYELAALAELGDRTVEWILTGTERAPLAFAYRANAPVAADVESPGREYARIVAERFDDAVDFGFAPETVDLAAPERRGGWVEIADRCAQAAVRQLGANIVDLDWASLVRRVEEAFSINVAVLPLAHGLDGLSLRRDPLRLIVVATTENPGRQRFALAHELGHVIFGHGEGAPIEETILTDNSSAEATANVFAASFLMPRDEVLKHLRGRSAVEAFAELVLMFRVTPSSMAWRLVNLGVLDKGAAHNVGSISSWQLARECNALEHHRLRTEQSLKERPSGRLTDAYIGAYIAGHVGAMPVCEVSRLPLGAVEQILDDVESADAWPDVWES